jgi:hypothetical protein
VYSVREAHILTGSSILDPDVNAWLEWGILDLIRDYYLIREHFYEHAIGAGISDYSYLITPAFKALEGTLLQVANRLGLNLEKSSYRIGWILSKENLDKFCTDVLDRVKTLTQEAKMDIRTSLEQARLILKPMRHIPVHYQGESKKTFTKAFDVGDAIIVALNSLVGNLIKNNAFNGTILSKQATRA